MHLIVLGLSHKTAPVNVREKFAIPEDSLVDFAQQICERGYDECLVLSTCNRVELYAVASDARQEDGLRRVLAQTGGGAATLLDDHLYAHSGEDAVLHLFRVASSLDSMVVGEPQILGQLKSAFRLCRDAGRTGPQLNRIVERAFAIAKRVRRETGIANNVVSMSSIAVDLAQQILGRLDHRTGALVGAGKMGELAARHLKQAGLQELFVANRSMARAQRVAERLGGHPRGLSELPRLLQTSDVVITSTGARQPIIDVSMMKHVMRKRKYRPIFFIDIAVPRNVSPKINDLDNVYVYDVDDLTAIAEDNLAERRREADAAEALVQAYASRFVRELAGARVTPTIVALRQRADAIKANEIERVLKRLDIDGDLNRDALQQVADAIGNKLLHGVMTALKREAGTMDGDQLLDWVQSMYDLNIEEDS
ncbi:MAG: glutamyl-tRNA reductase [Myxococcota bacterium]|nr:glutamyl-tRNA reductase [Myxococcota bacterium]